MAHFSIISSQSGSAIWSGAPRYVGAYLKPGYLEFPAIGSPVAIAWHVGDYVVYPRTGKTYRLYRTPQAAEQGVANMYGASFLYENVQFFDDSKQLEFCPFTDLVPGDNTVHFSTQNTVSFFGKPLNVAERIHACLEAQYGAGSWEVRIVTTTDPDLLEVLATEIEFSVTGVNCLEVLDKVYDEWGGLGWIHSVENGKNIITIGASNVRTGANTTVPFSYGDGLVRVERSIANSDRIGTRLFAYGSMKNMDATYYRGLDIYHADSVDIEHLMIPLSSWGTTSGKPDARKAYIENAAAIASLGLIPRTAYFDGTGDLPDIHPTIERMTIGEVYDAGGAGYVPDLSKWSRSDRIDEIVSATNPTDKGTSAEQGQKYAESIDSTLNAVSASLTQGSIHQLIWSGITTKRGRLTIKFGSNLQTFTMASGWTSPEFSNLHIEIVTPGGNKDIPLSVTAAVGNAWTIVLPESVSMNDVAAGQIEVYVDGYVFPGEGSYVGPWNYTFNTDPSTPVNARVEYELAKTFSVRIPQIGFDIDDYADLGEGKTISMKTGMCAGRDFEIKDAVYVASADAWDLTLYRAVDEDLNIMFPNADYGIAAGDQYVLLDIAMPEMYVTVASARLLAAAQKLLADISVEQPFFSPQIDAKVVYNESRILREGMWMDITQEGVREYVIIDSITIDENGSNIPTYEVALRQRKGLDWTENIGNSSSSRNTRSVSGGEAMESDGTVTSVGLEVPTGLEVSGSPITSAGVLRVGLADGYKIPLISELVNYFEPNGGLASLIQLKPAYDYLGPRKGLVFGETAEADVENSPAHLMLRNFGTAQNPKYALYTPFALVTGGDQIVIGGEPGGGGSGGGKNYLHELLDVYGNPGDVKRGDGTIRQGGDLLGYNSSLGLWVAVDKTTFLSGYATQTWVGQQIAALNLGDASTYGIGQIASGNNGLVTGGSVFSYVTGVLSSVLKFQGTTTTAISDGSTTNPIVINGVSYTAQKGDVVLYGGKEYLWQGSSWEQLGDESSWALKTTTITAGTGLAGGGSLASNRTIRLSDASIASLALADTAYQKPSSGIPATDLASAVQTSLGYADTLNGYFSNGVLGTSHLPALYIGDATVKFAAQTAQNIGGLGNLTLANGRAIKFLDNPTEGTATSLTALQFTTSNKLFIGFDTSIAGAETILYGEQLSFRRGTDHVNGMTITAAGITAYGHVLPNISNSKDLGSSDLMWRYTYTKRVYLTSSVYLEYVDNSGNGYVHINAPLVTDGDQIVVSGTPGGGGSGGVNWLYELQDVDPTLSSPTGGMVLQYDATSHLWKGAASDTIGITTAGTVAELNAATPTTEKRVWSPSVLASWLAGKNYITGADAVSNVAVGGTGHTDELAVTKDGSTSYLTVPYANTVKRFKRYDGTTGVVGGYDLNTLLSGGGITSQYNLATTWGNGPDGMRFGGAVQLNPLPQQTLAMQLAWDIDHTNVKTGKLWWRDSIYKNSMHTWGEWHLIYDDANTTISNAALTLGSATLGTSSTPIGYATQSRRPWAVAGTQEAGGFDLNTVLAGGGAIRNVNSSSYWAHAPAGATYFGMAWQLNPSNNENGAMQFFWDGNYSSTTAPTGRLFWRLRNSVGWADDWHRIYDSANANLSTIDWDCKDLHAYGVATIGTATAATGATLTVDGVIASTGDQVVTSDIRMKTNLKTIELKVEDIAKCRAVTFDWGTGGHSFGSIAQDWEPILPEAVKDGGVKALAYGQAALVAAINIAKHETEQDREIRKLKEKVKNLEEEVKRLRS